MMEAFGETRCPQIRQAVRRTFESTGIRFPVIGADRVAVVGGGGSARGLR
ncbi:hypothetical protein [Methylobacterium sp. E-066]|nr:hypothetical protein [Methylobacterium sp. E-066]MCJ2139790.1 hypothetical protein [Methylobacterium sp. E-066]